MQLPKTVCLLTFKISKWMPMYTLFLSLVFMHYAQLVKGSNADEHLLSVGVTLQRYFY
jgi:hypothetical protein